MTSNRPPTFVRSFVANVAPAYLGPAAMVSVNARLIPNRETGRALGHAALTTIGLPSAIAATAVFLAMNAGQTRLSTTTAQTSRTTTVLRAALGCAVVAGLVSAFLVGNGFVADRLFLDAIPSAAISGAITSAKLVRNRSRLGKESRKDSPKKERSAANDSTHGEHEPPTRPGPNFAVANGSVGTP